ncbi:unnamed protein product [Arctogadus glacialis]
MLSILPLSYLRSKRMPRNRIRNDTVGETKAACAAVSPELAVPPPPRWLAHGPSDSSGMFKMHHVVKIVILKDLWNSSDGSQQLKPQ